MLYRINLGIAVHPYKSDIEILGGWLTYTQYSPGSCLGYSSNLKFLIWKN